MNTAFEPYQKRINDTYKGADKERMIADTRLAILNRMIENLLIEQEAKKSGITVQDEEVMASIKDIAANKKMTMEALKQSLSREGTTFEAYKKDVRNSMIRIRLLRREVRSKVSVSNEEIGAYYSLHRDEYEGTEAVRIKQILLIFPKNMDKDAKARLHATATDLLNRLKAGESFDQLAAHYSQGPAASSGGDLGFVEKGAILPEVEKVAFSLEKGSISDIIESPVGYHIIKVTDRRGAGIKPIETVREEIKAKLENEKIDKKYESWLSELKAKSLVEIKL
jgi:parvulin-like peptidyl-prolyl isomerase